MIGAAKIWYGGGSFIGSQLADALRSQGKEASSG
jgi:hypothetical protein